MMYDPVYTEYMEYLGCVDAAKTYFNEAMDGYCVAHCVAYYAWRANMFYI